MHLVPSPQQNYFSVEKKKGARERGRERETHMSNASATIRETVYNYLFGQTVSISVSLIKQDGNFVLLILLSWVSYSG